MKKYSLYIVTLLGILSTNAFGQPELSHFDALKDKFNNATTNSITEQRLEGNYLGTCFSSEGNDPLEVFLVTKNIVTKKTIDKDAGPDFPEQTIVTQRIKMGIFKYDSNEDTENEKAEADYLLDNESENLVLSIAGGVATSKASNGDKELVTFNIKLGFDGFLYGRQLVTPAITSKDLYCYFYKKLN